MTKLVCSGCGRAVDVEAVHGDEVCKKCNKPMEKVTGESTAQEIVETSEEKESGIVLPTKTNFCGELPTFEDKSII